MSNQMTVRAMREYLGSDDACNAYVLAHLGDGDTSLIELGVERAMAWLDGRDDDELFEASIIHGRTALRIGG